MLDTEKQFAQLLLQWHKNDNKRLMPWKGEKDPYKIWLSEIILQQTRVEQGLSYYEKFIQQFPTIFDLANAQDEVVFKLWEGLGYYNRCKNLLHTARLICKEYHGKFPTEYDAILALKGIGPYTAAAIASFAFNQPYAVVDGNVFRVLARVFGISTAIDSLDGKVRFTHLANKVLTPNSAAMHNQAIMDFGATVCKPFNPLCFTCVFNTFCVAKQEALVNQLPVKEKVLLKKKRFFSYFVFEYQGNLLIKKRTNSDIWQNLHEFYLVESAEAVFWNQQLVAESLLQQLGIEKANIVHISPMYAQQLTHQKIQGQFVKIVLPEVPKPLQQYQLVPLKEVSAWAFPKFINQYLEANSTQSSLF